MNKFNNTRELMRIFISDDKKLRKLSHPDLKDLIITYFEEQESLEIVDEIERNLHSKNTTTQFVKELLDVFMEKIEKMWWEETLELEQERLNDKMAEANHHNKRLSRQEIIEAFFSPILNQAEDRNIKDVCDWIRTGEWKNDK